MTKKLYFILAFALFGGSVQGIDIAMIAVLVLSGPASAQTPDAQTRTFDPFRETPAEYNALAQWFRDAKLGIFVH